MPTQPEVITKAFEGVEIKDAEKGEVEAVIATLQVKDKDGEIITPDAIKNGVKAAMSSYGHDLIYGDLPVGRGKIFIEGDKAIFRGKMFLSTTRGRDTFEVLKEMGSDQQWSFGFRVLGAELPTEDQRKQGVVRILTKLDAFEVSPVIIGAGVGTQTLGVKSEKDEPDPAIEAARLETERKAAEDAETARVEAEAKAKEIAGVNADIDRLFSRRRIA